MKPYLIITIFTAFSVLSQASTFVVNSSQWKSCGPEKCYELKAEQVARSIFSKKLFAQNVVLRLVSRKSLDVPLAVVKAKRAMYDEEQDEWVLMQVDSGDEYRLSKFELTTLSNSWK